MNMPRSNPTIPAQTYGSARDLPSFRELDEQLRGMKLLTRVIARKQRPKIVELEAQVNRMVNTIDRFYAAVGARNWIFHECLKVDDIARLLDEASDVEAIEAGLIEIYRTDDTMKFWVTRLGYQPLLRQRAHQIRRAYEHFLDDQFDSCVLHLLAVMDGYVSDLDPGNRRGLHARAADEVIAWDSVVGHHLGLSHALATFLKPITKRIDEPVFDVYRHGIVHGMVVNFDNPIVACKAWSMLFALNDWAVSMVKATKPIEPKPTWSDTWQTLKRLGESHRIRNDHNAVVRRVSDAEFATIDCVREAQRFLEAWQRGQWARVAEFMPPQLRGKDWSGGRTAKAAKDTFERFNLTLYELTECSLDQAQAAGLTARVTVNGEQRTMKLPMVHYNSAGNLAVPSDNDTAWKLAVWAPHTFFNDED